jgi:hypothetical protein
MNCSNYRRISLPSTKHKILFNFLLSRLTPYAKEIIGVHECGFRHKSTTGHVFCSHQILLKKWKYHKAAHQLFIDFNKAYSSFTNEVMYNILIGFYYSHACVKSNKNVSE